MKKAIFITVRSASTRLPQKCFLEIAGRPTIEHLINRVKRARGAELIVLCTTEQAGDEELCRIAERNGISFFRGSAEDKLMRWRGAADKYDVEMFVTADGDDLFCEPELIDLAFTQYDSGKADFIEGKGLICGSFTYALKAEALRKVCEIKDTAETEMMWVYFTDTGLFKTEELKNVPTVFKRPEIRMTLDYEDDFRFFKTIIEHFKGKQEDFSLRDIVAFLDRNPDVIKINQFRQAEFLANQKKKTKLVLKKEK